MEDTHPDLILRIPCPVGRYSGAQSDGDTQHFSSSLWSDADRGGRGAQSLVSVTSRLIAEISSLLSGSAGGSSFCLQRSSRVPHLMGETAWGRRRGHSELEAGDGRRRDPFQSSHVLLQLHAKPLALEGKGRKDRTQGLAVYLGPGDNEELAGVSEQAGTVMSPGLDRGGDIGKGTIVGRTGRSCRVRRKRRGRWLAG